MRLRTAIALTVACAGALTLLASTTSLIRFGYLNPALHVLVETSASFVPALTGVLLLGRFGRSQQARDLVLAASLGVLAAANLILSVGPAVVEADRGRFAAWGPVGPRLLGAALLALAAVMPERVVLHPRREATRVGAACALAVAACALAVVAAGRALPPAEEPPTPSGGATGPLIVGSPLALGAQLAGAVLYAVAAVGFARRAERGEDPLMPWLAVAAVLAAFSRVNYFLFPSLYSAWFYTGDILRLASFAAILGGAVTELARTQQELAEAAAQEERRRLARDLHDGVAQDLAFIVQHGRRLLRRDDAPPDLRRLLVAAQGALDESRHAISSLRLPHGRPLPELVAAAAQDVAGREGGQVELDLADGISVPARTEEALVRIVREATINAIRHGQASRVRIELHEHPGLRLRLVVADDGRGFDVAAASATPGRMGLRSMAERAERIGAAFDIASSPGGGSRVRVELP